MTDGGDEKVTLQVVSDGVTLSLDLHPEVAASVAGDLNHAVDRLDGGNLK